MTVNYRDYLHLDEVLGAQTPLGRPGDVYELRFIITHQAVELWFKLMVCELRRVREQVERQAWASATLGMKQLAELVDAVVVQLRTLRSLPAREFHRFRAALAPASGAQSLQFRQLEILSGLRSPQYLAALTQHHGGTLPPELQAALAEGSLAHALSRAAHPDWHTVYEAPQEHPQLQALAEQCLDYDESWRRWRNEHIVLVERTLGRERMGTGGMPISYLYRTLDARFFPFLWSARSA